MSAARSSPLDVTTATRLEHDVVCSMHDPVPYSEDQRSHTGSRIGSVRSHTGSRIGSVRQEEPRASKTLLKSQRLRSLSHPLAHHLADGLEACARRERGRRCDLPVCPRCEVRRAKRRRRHIEERLRELPPRTRLALVTVTANADTIERGHDELVRGLRQLRRRRVWAPIVAGVGQIELVPSASGRWHVHAHILAVLRRAIDCCALRREWLGIVGEDIAGNVHVAPITRRFVDSSATFLGGRALRQQARRRYGRAERHRAASGGSRSAAPSMEFYFRALAHTSGRSDVERG